MTTPATSPGENPSILNDYYQMHETPKEKIEKVSEKNITVGDTKILHILK